MRFARLAVLATLAMALLAAPFAAEAQPGTKRSPTARFTPQLHRRQGLHA